MVSLPPPKRHEVKTVERDRNNPLDEAHHLRKIADMKRGGLSEEDQVKAVQLVMTPAGRAAMWNAEASALERGYRLGRIMAAADVRIGLDIVTGMGSVHYDSDVEPPPVWLMDTAEKLARGDG